MIELFLNDENINKYGFILEGYSIGKPEKRLNKVSIPGRNGDIDFSKAITGYVSYQNRTIQVLLSTIGSGSTRDSNCEALINEYDGKEVEVHFSNLEGYFTGMCSLESKSTEVLKTTLTLSFDVYPFRIKNLHSKEVTLSESIQTIILENLVQPTKPIFKISDSCNIIFHSKSYDLANGNSKIDILLSKEDNGFDATGSGTLTILYYEEVL